MVKQMISTIDLGDVVKATFISDNEEMGFRAKVETDKHVFHTKGKKSMAEVYGALAIDTSDIDGEDYGKMLGLPDGEFPGGWLFVDDKRLVVAVYKEWMKLLAGTDYKGWRPGEEICLPSKAEADVFLRTHQDVGYGAIREPL